MLAAAVASVSYATSRLTAHALPSFLPLPRHTIYMLHTHTACFPATAMSRHDVVFFSSLFSPSFFLFLLLSLTVTEPYMKERRRRLPFLLSQEETPHTHTRDDIHGGERERDESSGETMMPLDDGEIEEKAERYSR